MGETDFRAARHRRRRCRSCGNRGGHARAALLPPDPLPPRLRADAPEDAPTGAGGRADVGPLRHARPRHRGSPAPRARRLPSPTGRTRATCRSTKAASTSTITSTYIIEFLRLLGPDLHVIAVCQPTVPVLAAVSIMSSGGDSAVPRSMILMAGPIDPRKSPTQVNEVATGNSYQSFEQMMIDTVPCRYRGAGRRVHPASSSSAPSWR